MAIVAFRFQFIRIQNSNMLKFNSSIEFDMKIFIYSQTVCVTQPRRVAAVTLGVRVADEVGCQIGQTIGYSVRFDSKYSAESTRVKECG